MLAPDLRRSVLLTVTGLLALDAGAALPRVASINLCADQLVLELAAPDQIVTLSWLASDPEESRAGDAASHYPVNFGGVEELLRFEPEVVVAGSYTAQYARELLARLGLEVIELPPAETVGAIVANVRAVAAAIDRRARGVEVIASMRAKLAALDAQRPSRPVGAIVLRPGNFTVGRGSLADTLMQRAGLVNLAAAQGLDRWGSLSIESLLASRPELLILTRYRDNEPSLANEAREHPALRALGREVPTVRIAASLWACGLPQSLESVAMLERAAQALATP